MSTLNTPQYTIRVRDANLVPQGALSAWDAGDIVLRMNDVGKWALTVRADDPLRSLFATRGAGIIVTRDLGQGAGAQTIMSGPIWTIERKAQANVYTLGGPTDEWWLAARNALPAGGRPYVTQALLSAPLRYYRLGEASGTVAADISGNAQNGTYAASGVTYGAAGSVSGDPDTAVTLNGTSGDVSLPTAGLPTGNAPWSIKAAVKIAANPSVLAMIAAFGAGATKSDALLYINTSGQPVADSNSGPAASGAALSLNVWHHLVATYDGTNVRLYKNGTLAGTSGTTGPITVGSSYARIGAWQSAPIDFLPGSVDEVTIHNVALSAAQVSADYAAWAATHGAYDTRTGLASTVILAYVTANLIAPINTDRALAVLSAAADPGVGTSVTGNARWDTLLALCQQLASSGGDIGFRIVQTANGALTFSVYQPSDKSANAKFSQDLQNLFDYSYALAGPTVNAEDVLGGGVGAARTVVRVADATSIANWGLVEGVHDSRGTVDTPTLLQQGTADINAGSEQTNLALTPRDTATVQYGRDYNLGDIVAVTIDGNTIINKIRSVHLQLQQPDQEIVTPGIGNPTQGEVARWFDAYAARAQALKQVQAKLNQLSAAQ